MYRSLRTKTWLPLALAFVMVTGSWVLAAYAPPQSNGASVGSNVGTRDYSGEPVAISAKEIALNGLGETPELADTSVGTSLATDTGVGSPQEGTIEIQPASIEQRFADVHQVRGRPGYGERKRERRFVGTVARDR